MLPIKVNGIQMNMIFDTGASSISISELEALFLIKQGAISEDDILGTQEFQTATGQISEGTIINIKSVQIGDRTIFDVKANVVHNLKVPLLLGLLHFSSYEK